MIKLAPRTVPLYREYVARTDAFYTVQLKPRLSGELVSFHFKEGQTVRKGQLLFQLDPVPYQIGLQAAQAHLQRAESDRAESQAQYNKSQADVARYEPLAKIHAIPEQDLADARAAEQVREAQRKQADADVLIQQAAVNKAQLDLAYTRINSPITGTIGQREVDPGNLVSPGDTTALATISSDDPVLVTFVVSDAEYLRYFAPRRKSSGSGALRQYHLILADGSTYGHPGSFHAISRALNQQTDTLGVVLLFPNPDHMLRPGEFARVRTNLQVQANSLLVPVTAVETLQGTRTVLLVDGGNHVVQRTISSAGRQGEDYIVTGGLQPGDRVIVQGQNKVTPGDKVTVQTVSADNPPAASDLAGAEP